MRKLIKNGFIITCGRQDRVLDQGNIIIEDEKIAAITTEPVEVKNGQFQQVIDATNKLVIPGLINSHYHSYANLVKATTENLPLEPWMLYAIIQGRYMEPEDIYYNVLLGCAEMLATGTTTVVDHLAQGREGLEAAMCAYRDAGIRAFVAPMISDKHYYDTIPVDPGEIPDGFAGGEIPSASSLIDTTVELLKTWQDKNQRLRVMFGPSGPQRCSDELLIACARLAEGYDTGLHTHVLETKLQKQMAAKLYGKDMVEHLFHLGVLNRRTSLVHAIWLSEEEIKLVARQGATVVHNPSSNLNTGAGFAPINLYYHYGVPVALATDGANAGGNLDMFEIMKLGVIIHKANIPNPDQWPTAWDGLRMATINSARVTQREDFLGTLEPGKAADIVILNPERSTALVPLQDPIRQLVYGNGSRAVETVLVNGQVVVDRGSVTFFDEGHVRSTAERRAQELMERVMEEQKRLKGPVEYLKKVSASFDPRAFGGAGAWLRRG